MSNSRRRPTPGATTMRVAELPVAFVMQRRAAGPASTGVWCDERWAAVAVVPHVEHMEPVVRLDPPGRVEHFLLTGPTLELHTDENDGYFENWAAPEPKVFVAWQMRGERAAPVLASVSYAEGARMLDSGDPASGVPMPLEVHEWLTAYLQAHYRPRERHRSG